MIRVLNTNQETVTVLENAFNISYEKEVNAIWQASFSLPLDDPKVDKVELLNYVEIEGDLYRIIPKLTIKNESTHEVHFQCEHVLATLLDSSLFRYHQLSGFTTEQVLHYLLERQKNKHWQLGTVEFTRYFHYAWENENLLSALFSVPKPFDEQYLWTFDTKSYPWTLNLVKPSSVAISRIKEGYNLVGYEIEENPMSQFNRIYPLGAGEGVNQLTIESVNNGLPYIEDRQEGEEVREYIWVDKRFTDAESLKASAQALLDEWKTPRFSWKVFAAEVSSITGLSIDEFEVGTVVRLQLDDFPTLDLRIMKEAKPDVLGDPANVELEIGNVLEDLSTTQADLERRQQINELYSQGATNILNFTYQDNADSNIPATIGFFIDDDVVNVNTVELTFRTKKFRAYSRATEGGGAIVKSTSSGGGTVKSTSSGGGTSRSTASGGGTTRTSSAGGNHRHMMFSGTGYTSNPNPETSTILSAADDLRIMVNANTSAAVSYYTQGASGNHTHSIEFPNHTHEFTVPNHTHDVEIPNHTHEIELPNHTHDVKHEIVELETLPSQVTIKVDGNEIPYNDIKGDRIDLIDYLERDNEEKITRGWHEVEILPNGLARIEADLILRVFIQSQLGGSY